jgi:hypothetical protein
MIALDESPVARASCSCENAIMGETPMPLFIPKQKSDDDFIVRGP